jgi:beta-lactamase regulating signal transducer with metallopeptidase domain
MTAIVQLSALPLVHALGWTLLHFCWQGALVGVGLACALDFLPSRASRLRHFIACAAMALMVMLSVGTFYMLATNEQPRLQRFAIAAVDEHISHALNNSFDYPAESWSVRLERVLDQSLPAVIGCWFAGVLALLCRLNLGLLAVRRMKSIVMEPVPAEIQQMLRGLLARLGIQRTIKLLNSARVQAPAVIGWLKPAILLPIGCVAGLSTLQIEAILAHELAHIRRHDYLVSLFQSVMETVFFYHPAVWWVSNQIRCEREHCCDDLAVAICGDGIAYARALSILEERRNPALTGAVGATGGELKMRIARLLNLSQAPVSRRAPAVVLLVFAAAVAGLAVWGSARAESTPAQKTATTRQHSVTTMMISSQSAQQQAAPHQSPAPTPPINSQIAQHPAAPSQDSFLTPPTNSDRAVSLADTSMQARVGAQTEGEGISDEILIRQRTPDLSCTFYGADSSIENDVRQSLEHPGDCEVSTAGAEIYYCRESDGNRLRQVQIGCKWKVQRLHEWELQQEERIRTACSKSRCN